MTFREEMEMLERPQHIWTGGNTWTTLYTPQFHGGSITIYYIGSEIENALLS